MASARTPGHLAESNQSAGFKQPIQQLRGVTNFGIRSRPLGSGTIQITAGTASPGVNTVTATVNGVAISGVVDWITSHTATAQDLAQSINATTGHNYVATSSTDTVTVMQRTSGAITGSLAATVAGDVTTTDTDFSNDTDTWTEHVGGDTFDGDLYYELGFSSALITNITDADDMLLVDINLYCDGQAFQYWMGGMRGNAAASALIQGLPVATVTWEKVEWMGAGVTMTIKLAADEELLYKVRYI